MAALDASRSAKGEGRSPRHWIGAVAFMAGAGIVLGLFGPFGTFQALATLPRIGFWIACVLAIGTINIAVRSAVKRLAGARIGEAGTLLATSLVSAVPGGLLLFASVPALLTRPGDAPSLPQLLGQIVLVNLCLNFIALLNARRSATVPTPAPAPQPEPPRPDTWSHRLPAELRAAALLALEAEDHYLRVHTEAGSTLILLRLGDAMAELGEARGAQVHRSWWVARDAVERVERSGEKAALVLRGGLRVPVSRGNRAKLAAMGWS